MLLCGRLGQMRLDGSQYLFWSSFAGRLPIALCAHMLVVRKAGQVDVMRCIVPTDNQIIVAVEPVVSILFQSIAVILLVNPNGAAVNKRYHKPEGMVIHALHGNGRNKFIQDGPNVCDSSLQQRRQGVSPLGGAAKQ